MENKFYTDSNGYIKDEKKWSKSFAYLIAEQENILLTDEHWKIIMFIRNFFLKFNTSPTSRMLIRAISKNKKIDSMYLYKLFPNGIAKQAAKMAGIPKPTKCI
ncbi:sulfur relay protein TusE [Candidatus Riesia pthiripubis]|uniref:Sulfurtransferase n=1 Tax=Candidatus Riesia pthiripubis TaxID=428412 RepID=A0A1V0HPB2_9ENTR|nr:sulfur relay protein TusE [Candidatus Riesia pthiripubis]